MTTFDQPTIDFDTVSHPIAGTTLATVTQVAEADRATEDWRRFTLAVRGAAYMLNGVVDPADVRARLTVNGELIISPRRLSAFYTRAVAEGLIAFSHWGLNTDTKGRNAGRPARIYKSAVSA